jgi:hypothetical protein
MSLVLKMPPPLEVGCEYTNTKTPGRTKIVTLGSIILHDKCKATLVYPAMPPIYSLVGGICHHFATIIFVNEKNDKKMNVHSQHLPFFVLMDSSLLAPSNFSMLHYPMNAFDTTSRRKIYLHNIPLK